MTGAEVSTGWVASLLPEAAGLVDDSVDLIRALLVMGHILHADETPPASAACAAGCTWPAATSSPCSTSPRAHAPGLRRPEPSGQWSHYGGITRKGKSVVAES
ncbi:hypothetical protein [Streptomyces sp. SID12501]|uniref:hypothetical protein n=1 Tax=Streptomyces sp. SID12501 TaxID=2706042 RepID=UPI0034E08DAD